MDALQTLLDKIKETRSLSSDAALARLLDVKPQTMSNWRKGHNLPDTVECARIAKAAKAVCRGVCGGLDAEGIGIARSPEIVG